MPVYSWICESCAEGEHTFTEVRPMSEFDKPGVCPASGVPGRKLIVAPTVMQHAYPDGTRRFDNVRRYREAEDAKRAAAKSGDKVTQAVAQREINRLTGKE